MRAEFVILYLNRVYSRYKPGFNKSWHHFILAAFDVHLQQIDAANSMFCEESDYVLEMNRFLLLSVTINRRPSPYISVISGDTRC